ncbi:MAG: hypothetical protein LUQ37_09610 [Methanoregulaceae archaeon]|jgi:hypothetical protein|nr:hypothetical protein [Methanoregulaceae archaeon]
MSTAPYLNLISELLPVQRRDFALEDVSILNPMATTPLVDGEWLELNDSYQLKRGSGEAAKPSWVCFAERGRYDTQAIGKTPVLYVNGFEADTAIFAAANMAVGVGLAVDTVTCPNGLTGVRGLKAAVSLATGEHLLFGFVTRIIGTGASQKIRFWCPNAPAFKHFA